MERLKVLYLINYAGGAGTEKYVKNLISYLNGNKCDCFLCYAVPGQLSEWAAENSIPSLQTEMRSFRDKTAAARIAKYCKENKIDVIHAQYPRENCIAVAVKKMLPGIKVVFTSHLTINQPFYWKLINKKVSKQNTAVISVCKEGEDILKANGIAPEKIITIFNGINPDSAAQRDRSKLEEFGVTPEDTVFIALARFAPEKGLSFLLDCAAKLKKESEKSFKLLICGEGELFDEIKAKAAALGISGDVILPGYRKDTADLLAASDVFVISSASGEAMSFAVLEAMNSSLPVVATDVGGTAYMVKDRYDCGFVTLYGDTEGYTAAMKTLLEDEGRRKEYGAAARRKVEECFSLDKLLDDVYETYLK